MDMLLFELQPKRTLPPGSLLQLLPALSQRFPLLNFIPPRSPLQNTRYLLLPIPVPPHSSPPPLPSPPPLLRAPSLSKKRVTYLLLSSVGPACDNSSRSF